MWARLCKQASIENLRVHDLRHNWASTAIRAGLTLAQIGKQLGHRSTQTTHRYAHLMGEAAAANATKGAELISPLKP